jgi:molecular chaperone HscA
MEPVEIHEPGQSPLPHQQISQNVIGIDLGTTNSLVACNDKVLGKIIKSEINLGNNHIVKSFKRLMGKNYEQALTLNLKQQFPNLINSHNNLACLKNERAEIITPIELSAIILKKLKNQAEQELNEKITKAVITVPAYFNDAERQATKEAALIAGLDVMRLLNEPTAAALAYGLDKKISGKFMVYDLGGGTFDISILSLNNSIFEVIATKGDVNLGGDDFDLNLMNYFNENSQQTISLEQAQKIKEQLTTTHEVEHGHLKINRPLFTKINQKLLNKTLKLMKLSLIDAKLRENEIDGIILVGGSTKMPIIRDFLTEHFKIKIFNDLDPDRIVAIGAGIHAHNLQFGSNNLLIDILPLSLGLEMMGGIVERVVPRNTTIPCSIKQEFTTYQDNQTGIILNIVQGERDLAKDCRHLGKFVIKNIPPMKAGIAKILVKFMVDADGMLTVEAIEQTTKQKQVVHINPSSGLDRNQIRNILFDSIEHNQEDLNERKFIETKVKAEQLANMIEQEFENHFEYYHQDLIKTVQEHILKIKNAINNRNVEEIEHELEMINPYVEEISEIKIEKEFNKKLQGMTIDQLDKN